MDAGLKRSLRAVALAAVLALAGCATAEKQMYVDWIAVANPAEVCAGKSDCVQHAMYKGKDLCRIVTPDKNVSYARLGEQMRECLRQSSPAVAAKGS
jgi:hypothetical protein